jgi:hypothetical protein
MSDHLKCVQRRALIALSVFACAAVFAKDGPQGLRFNSPGVLDLAERTQKIARTSPLPATALPAPDAEKILAAPALAEEQSSLPFSDDVFGCKTPSTACSVERERKLLSIADGSVKRIDKQLVVAVGSGKALVFVDWKMPESKTADGDEETHWYLGSMPGSAYHRVEVQFGHDAPGSFLINPQSGKTAFVHNGADVVAPSSDGKHLLTFNTLNPPLSIRVAALDATGPRLELQCEVSANASSARAAFKGWHDAVSFDLAIQPDQGKRSSALRIALTAGAWSMSVSDAALLAEIGFACH